MCHHHDWTLDALREEAREADPEESEPESELETEGDPERAVPADD